MFMVNKDYQYACSTALRNAIVNVCNLTRHSSDVLWDIEPVYRSFWLMLRQKVGLLTMFLW